MNREKNEAAEQAERLNEDAAAFKARLTDEQKEYLKDNAAIRIAVDMMKNSATVTEKKPEEEKKDEAEEKTEAKTEKKARAPRKTAKKADAEEKRSADVLDWFRKNWTAESIDEKLLAEDPTLEGADLDFKRSAYISDLLITGQDLPDQSYADYLSDKIYQELYKDYVKKI